ncbi:MAG: sorbosone dehydrogenase family protein, partial [Cytophagales bacterium]|nr:sorbosone dehydrogenase family protein [Cytophagales bacterium]
MNCSSCSSANSSATSISSEHQSSDLVSEEGLQLDKIKLPDGFKIGVYARVENARSLALSPNGTLFVGNRGGDKVYAVQDTNGDKKADKKYVIASGLRMPNGVAFRDGDLYVADVSKLWKFENIEASLSNPPSPSLIYKDYPRDAHHGWKYIAFGPDGKLYIPVGAPCNVCESKNELYASITQMDPDGSNREVYAKGIRNTVGFTWHPETGEMWFTDNGRDMMGDDKPPCELNRITSSNQHFGFPYCHGGMYLDDSFGKGKDCEDFVSPAQNFQAHVAPLGLKFITSTKFP